MRKHLGVNRSVDYFEFARAFAAIRGPIKKPSDRVSASYRRSDADRDMDRDSERDDRGRSQSREGGWGRGGNNSRDRDRYAAEDEEGHGRTARERRREVKESGVASLFVAI